MHFLIAFLFTASVAASQTQLKPEDLCRLDGVVINSATGEPVAKAQILLSRIDRQERPYSSTADAEGKFVFMGIEPGQYRMSATRNGFVRGSYGGRGQMGMGTALTLQKGQKMIVPEFKLIPHAVVTGRVVDADGEPVPYSQVNLLRSTFMQGRRQMVPMGNAMTNDLGEYRMFSVAPGSYILMATARNDEFSYMGSIDASGRESQEMSSTTYYPNVLDMDQAAKVVVAQGARLQGLDLRLLRSRVYKVSGQVTGLPGRGRNAAVNITSKGDTMAWMGFGRSMSQVQPDGKFEVRGVRPGVYTLNANVFEQEARVSGRIDVTVTNANVEGVVVALEKGFDVNGIVKIEGASADGVRVALEPKERGDPYFGGANGIVKDDGTFVFRQVSAGFKGSFRAYQIPDGYYLKSVKYGWADLLHGDTALTAGGTIEVTMSAGAAKIEGVVTNEKGAQAAGIGVVAIPADERARAAFRGAVTTDQSGRYSIKNLAPGEYSLIAIEGFEGGMDQDPEILKTYQSAVEKVTVKERAVENKPLKAVKAAEQ